MAIKYYAECDRCEESASEAASLTEREAIADAVEQGWRYHATGRIVCAGCAHEDAAERAEGNAEPGSRKDLATGMHYALVDLYGEELADRVEASQAHGALAHRVQQLEQAGHDLAEVFDSLEQGEARFVANADDPAAFLASRVKRYLEGLA